MNTPQTAEVTRVACWQAVSPLRFLSRLAEAATTAAAGGATVLITPEMSATGYHLGRARTTALAEPADGPLADAVREIAARTGVAIVYGWPERHGDAVYNSVHLVGETVTRYRKTHLYGEPDRSVFTAGDDLVVQARLGALTVGLLVCYDVEFPETVRAHALAGTDLLIVPTALIRPWEFVARTLVPARAFESQLFVAYVNWWGPEPDGYCGSSRVIGPDGRSRGEATDGECLFFADLDHAALAAARAATPYRPDRRADLYGGPR